MKEGIYKVSSLIWRKTVLKWYRDLKMSPEDRYWKEKVKHYGKRHKGIIFYVIRRRDPYCGLFSLYITTLVRIDEAIKKGYIPVVDMQSNFNLYLEEEKIGKENSWEYYFEQPMGYSLDEIQGSKKVVIGDGAVPEMFPYLDVEFLLGKKGNIGYWKELAQKYIRVKEEIKQYVNEMYLKMFSPEDRVLGIRCRGTDYIKEKPKNHPIQPEISDVLREAKRILSEYNCTKIFLMTEDRLYYQACKDTFGEIVKVYKEDFVNYSAGNIGEAMYEQIDSKYNMGMNYLMETMLLGKCNCLCAGCVSSTVGVLLMAENFEYIYLFDLGKY